MFTNISPFRLNLIFAQNKVFLAAKGGDVATKDIAVPAGNTGIAPGPVLSEFKVANVATRIDGGNIWVAKDTVVAKPGDVIPIKGLDVRVISAGGNVIGSPLPGAGQPNPECSGFQMQNEDRSENAIVGPYRCRCQLLVHAFDKTTHVERPNVCE